MLDGLKIEVSVPSGAGWCPLRVTGWKTVQEKKAMKHNTDKYFMHNYVQHPLSSHSADGVQAVVSTPCLHRLERALWEPEAELDCTSNSILNICRELMGLWPPKMQRVIITKFSAMMDLIFTSSVVSVQTTWTSLVAAAGFFSEGSKEFHLILTLSSLHFVSRSFPSLSNCGRWNVDIHLQSLNTLLHTCLIRMRS